MQLVSIDDVQDEPFIRIRHLDPLVLAAIRQIQVRLHTRVTHLIASSYDMLHHRDTCVVSNDMPGFLTVHFR